MKRSGIQRDPATVREWIDRSRQRARDRHRERSGDDIGREKVAPLRRHRRRPRDVKAAAAFRKAASRQRCCAVCGATGAFDAHHVVPAQWLRRNHPQLEWDRRNALRVCPAPCHANHESAFRRIPRRCLTEDNLAFIDEVGAGWLRDSLYPLEEAA